jgi:predicted tellurium resistance membrane protein TerC
LDRAPYTDGSRDRLGIDNIVFISILASKLPSSQQARARTIGLALAMITRILLLLSLTWIMRLTAPLFAVFQHEFSGRDLILLVGGIFLIWKSTREIHERLEGESESERAARGAATMGAYWCRLRCSISSFRSIR